MNEVEKKKNNIAAVTGVRGGIGKTWFAATLAHALAMLKLKTLFFDADLGQGNIEAKLGLSPAPGLDEVMAMHKTLGGIIRRYAPGNFDIVSGRPDSLSLSEIPVGRLHILGGDLAIVASRYHRVVMDLGGGQDRANLTLAAGAGRIIVVETGEPSSLTGVYEKLRTLSARCPNAALSVVVNQADSLREGRRTFDSLLKACGRYLGFEPELLGVVRSDTRIRDAIRAQAGLLTRYPTSEAAEDVLAIARKLVQ